MVIQSISIKGVAGVSEALAYQFAAGLNEKRIPAAIAAALPQIVLSLLYPDESSPTDMARLCGNTADAAWRVVFRIAGRSVRLSRSFSMSSLMMDVQDRGGRWKTVGRGGPDVKAQLARLTELPPPSLLESLIFSINPAPKEWVADDATATAGLDDEFTAELDVEGETQDLLTHNDYFGEMAAGGASLTPLTEEERERVGLEYRKARTADCVADQVSAIKAKLSDHIGSMTSKIDPSGKLAQIAQRLALIPEMRALTDDERRTLQDPDKRLRELDDRINQLEDDRLNVKSKTRKRPAWQNPVLFLGVLLTLAVTVGALVGGEAARQLLLGNVVTLGIALFGYFQVLGDMESSGVSSHKSDAIERRFEQLNVERERIQRLRSMLRDEFEVRSLAEYDELYAERRELVQQKEAMEQRHQSRLQSPEYQKLEKRKQRLEREIQERKQAAARLEEATVPTYELEQQLMMGGWDPQVVFWKPYGWRATLRYDVKRLAQIAMEYGLMTDQGATPAFLQSWAKIAGRTLPEQLDGLSLDAEFRIHANGDDDIVASASFGTAYGAVEALRLSLFMTLINGGADGLPQQLIRIHPFRMDEELIATNLRTLYENLGKKVQVILLESA